MDNETNKNSVPISEPVNPAVGSDDLIKNIVLSGSLEQEGLLDNAPELDKSLLKEVHYDGSALLMIIKTIFILLAIGSLASFMFFTLRLTDNLDFLNKQFNVSNVIKELSQTNDTIISNQTDLNFFRFLQAQSFLTNFTYYGDSYIKYSNIANSLTASSADKQLAAKKMTEYRPQLEDALINAKNQFAKPIAVELVGDEFADMAQRDSKFKEALISKLNAKAAELSQGTTDESKIAYKNYIQTIALVQNDNLRKLITSTDIKALDDEALNKTIKQINELVINDLTIIQKIKMDRIRWSDVIKEIETRTIAVDKYYNNNYYEDYGGIRYTNYDFDSKTKKVTISGDTKRLDTTNFTVIANLIDELNRSPIFKDTEMRSFSKTGSIEEGFTATLRLALTLNTENLGKPILERKDGKVSPFLDLTKKEISRPPATIPPADESVIPTPETTPSVDEPVTPPPAPATPPVDENANKTNNQ